MAWFQLDKELMHGKHYLADIINSNVEAENRIMF